MKYPLKEVIQLENTEKIKKNKINLLKSILILLLAFSAIMLFINYKQGYQHTFIGILVLMVIFIGELVAVKFIHNASRIFAVGKCLLLTAFFFYLLMGSDGGGDLVWFWFLAAPPFAVYISGLFWGFWIIIYGQVLLILLLWTPLDQRILTPLTEYLTKLPGIYFIVGAACLAMCYNLTCYQIEQQRANHMYKNELSEFKERRKVDRLTGLLNRDYAEEKICEALSDKRIGAFFLMDLDNFKMINDLKGHQAGDHVIALFADNLKKVFQDRAILSRLGGDEFIAYVPEYEGIEQLKWYANSTLDYANRLVDDSSLADKIGVCIGIALAPEDGTTFMELYTDADKAQYFAKHNGKKRYSFYEPAHENMERSVGADLQTLNRMVQDVNKNKGAYCVEYGSFSKIYQFMERNLTRQPKDSQILLFSVIDRAGSTATVESMEQAMTHLRKAVRFSLRSGDMMMDFSSTQIAVLLVNCDHQSGEMVVKRIITAYEDYECSSQVTIKYEMDTIHPIDNN